MKSMGISISRGVSLLALAFSTSPLYAQDDPVSAAPPPTSEVTQSGLEDIVVTAQKRAQSINNVGMSIAAISEAFAAGIGGAKTKSIAAAGHLPMVEQEAAFLKVVEDFLA